MVLSLGRLVWTSILFTNAVAILNEERFLSKSTLLPSRAALANATRAVGWGRGSVDGGDGFGPQAGGGGGGSVKRQLVTLISAVRTLLRSKAGRAAPSAAAANGGRFIVVPLIAVNILVIIYEVFLG